jgi:ribosomal protein S18 acetylase RimI-like enzyme
MEIEIIERLPSPDEYNQLRKTVGWGICDHKVIEKSLPNSLYCVCASSGNETVGMARVIGDGGLVYYIQDVIVLPEYQGQGLGAKMMDKVMAYIRGQVKHSAIIGLMSAKGKEPFYERYGFIPRPNENLGSGMTLLWEGLVTSEA